MSLLEHRPFIALEILSAQKISEIKSIIPVIIQPMKFAE